MIILVSGKSRKPNASEKEDKMSLAEMKAGEAVWWHISCMTKSEKIFLCVTKNVKTNTEFALLTLSRLLSLSRLCSAFDISVDSWISTILVVFILYVGRLMRPLAGLPSVVRMLDRLSSGKFPSIG